MPKRKSYAQGPSTRRGRGSKPGMSNKRVKRSGPGYSRTEGFYGRFAGRGSELKFFDTTNSFTVDSTGEVPVTGQFCLIPQGVTESSRVGRKCVIKSIQGKWNLTYTPGAGASAATIIAISLVQDTQCNGAAAAITDVYTGNEISQAHRNLANSQRFKVLKKWTIPFVAQSGVTTAYNQVQKHIEFYKKLSVPLEFSSTTGAITELKTNNIFLLASAFSSDDLVSVAGTTRLRFSDN